MRHPRSPSGGFATLGDRARRLSGVELLQPARDMSFFEPPQPPESADAESQETRYRMPAWFGPPHGVLPGVVPIEAVVVRTDAVAVAIGRVAAYPESFEVELLVVAADESEEALDHTPQISVIR